MQVNLLGKLVTKKILNKSFEMLHIAVTHNFYHMLVAETAEWDEIIYILYILYMCVCVYTHINIYIYKAEEKTGPLVNE